MLGIRVGGVRFRDVGGRHATLAAVLVEVRGQRDFERPLLELVELGRLRGPGAGALSLGLAGLVARVLVGRRLRVLVMRRRMGRRGGPGRLRSCVEAPAAATALGVGSTGSAHTAGVLALAVGIVLDSHAADSDKVLLVVALVGTLRLAAAAILHAYRVDGASPAAESNHSWVTRAILDFCHGLSVFVDFAEAQVA